MYSNWFVIHFMTSYCIVQIQETINLLAKLSKWLQNFMSQAQNSTSIILWPQWPQKRHTKNFENSLKSFQMFQILMGGMNFRERLQKTKRPHQWGVYRRVETREFCNKVEILSRPCCPTYLLHTGLPFFGWSDMYKIGPSVLSRL